MRGLGRLVQGREEKQKQCLLFFENRTRVEWCYRRGWAASFLVRIDLFS